MKIPSLLKNVIGNIVQEKIRSVIQTTRLLVRLCGLAYFLEWIFTTFITRKCESYCNDRAVHSLDTHIFNCDLIGRYLLFFIYIIIKSVK